MYFENVLGHLHGAIETHFVSLQIISFAHLILSLSGNSADH